MGFEKGHKFGKGRPKGSTNKTSKDIREVSAMMLKGQMELLEKKLPTLKDADYIKAIGLLYKYVLPQQKQIEMDVQNEEVNYTVEIIDRLDQVTNAQVEEVLDSLVEEETQKMKARKLEHKVLK